MSEITEADGPRDFAPTEKPTASQILSPRLKYLAVSLGVSATLAYGLETIVDEEYPQLIHMVKIDRWEYISRPIRRPIEALLQPVRPFLEASISNATRLAEGAVNTAQRVAKDTNLIL